MRKKKKKMPNNRLGKRGVPMKNILYFFAFVSICLGAKDIDPSNPTQMNTSLNPMVEYQSYNADSEPSYDNKIVKVEGQMSGPGILLLAEIGYGKSSFDDKSGMVDSRLRFFHLPYANEDENAFINAFGWSIDAFIPTGDYEDKLGSGSWVINPGVVSAHNFSWGALYPNLMYEYTIADDSALKRSLDAQDVSDTSQAIKFDLNISPKMPAGWWLMLTPSYTANVSNSDNGAAFRVFTGYFMEANQAIALEAQYDLAVQDDKLNAIQNGQEGYMKLQYHYYF